MVKDKGGPRIPQLPANSEISEMLRRRAQETGRSMRWNRNILLLTYSVLAVTLVVALRVESTLFAAVVAVPGLAIVWGFSVFQSRKMEKQIFEDDLRAYTEFLDSAAQHNSMPMTNSSPKNDSPLSDRELEVLQQIAGGLSNKQAALALSISEQTVKNHLKNVFAKLSVSDRTSAIVLGMRHGWIQDVTPNKVPKT